MPELVGLDWTEPAGRLASAGCAGLVEGETVIGCETLLLSGVVFGAAGLTVTLLGAGITTGAFASLGRIWILGVVAPTGFGGGAG